jgi:U3 small nucleolar RNA-associated protein MPP10
LSHPELHLFLGSLTEQGPAISTRSGGSKSRQDKPPAADEILPYTPLSGLTVEGLDPEQVWEQLELRAKSIGEAVANVGEGSRTNEPEDDDEEEDEGSDMDGGSDDEEMTLEEYERLMAEQGSDFDSDEDQEGSDGSEDEDEDEDEDGSGSEEDQVNFYDEEDGEALEGDSDDEEVDGMDDEELEGMDGEDDDEEDDEEDDDAPPTISQPSSSKSSKKHPELDDSFFSIDAFNKLTEEAEAGRVTSGRLGGDDEDEEEEGLGDMAGMLLDDLGAPNGDDSE